MKFIRIDELKEYENNPRKNDHAVEKVMESIREFGFKVPLVVDVNNVIVCGHTRFKAAKELGLNEVPCIVADDLTEDQIKAFRLVDNKTSELAEWDFELLEKEMADLGDFDFLNFGFEEPIDFNHIQDLLYSGFNNENFSLEKETFGITFNFPLDEKDIITKYINDKTKDYFVQNILEGAREYGG